MSLYIYLRFTRLCNEYYRPLKYKSWYVTKVHYVNYERTFSSQWWPNYWAPHFEFTSLRLIIIFPNETFIMQTVCLYLTKWLHSRFHFRVVNYDDFLCPRKSLIHYFVTANLPLVKIQFSHTVTNVAIWCLQLSVPGTTRSLRFISLVNV